MTITSFSDVCDRFVVAAADVDVELCDETDTGGFGFTFRHCLS